MGRGAVSNAQTNVGIGRNLSQGLTGAAQNISGQLTPQLAQESVTGLPQSVQDVMRTSARQSRGGAMSSAVGQGALTEERTRNAGAANPAIEESARGALRQGSADELAVQQASEADRERAQAAFQNLYGTQLGQGMNALNLSNQAIGQWTGASKQVSDTWVPIVQQLIANAKYTPGGAGGGVSFGSGGGG